MIRDRFTSLIDTSSIDRAVRTYERLRAEAARAGRRWRNADSHEGRRRTGRAYHRALQRRDRAKRAITPAALRVFGSQS